MATIAARLEDSVLILQLNHGKANPINLKMIEEMRMIMRDAKSNETVAGVVLTGQSNFFSAGLDVVEMYDYDEEQNDHFWHKFLELIGDLVAFPKPLIGALTGHSIAGGCLLALCCDYRVMTKGRYKIGLNEVKIGIVLPLNFIKLYTYWLGQQKAYQLIMDGQLLSPEAAQTINMIDEIAEPEAVLSVALQKMKSYLDCDANTWQATKQALREELLQYFEKEDIPHYFAPTRQQWWHPNSRAIIKSLVEQLRK